MEIDCFESWGLIKRLTLEPWALKTIRANVLLMTALSYRLF